MKSLLLVCLLLPLPALAGTLTLEQFQEKMKKHVGSLSGKTTAAVQMEVLGKDKELFSHNKDLKLIPASNTKLVTTLVALEKMKPAYTFTTKVIKRGDELILSSNGDPYLVSERLYLLARDVARSGLKKVQSIKVDSSAFSENYRGLIDWDNSGEPFTAMVAPTSLNFNSLEIHVLPTKSGAKPRLELGPEAHGYAVLQNEVLQNSGYKRNLSARPIKVEGNKEVFLVSGSIGRSAAPAIVYASVTQPESYIAHAFAALLRKEGITVKEEYGGRLTVPVEGGEILSQQESPLLMDVVRLFNTFSNNFMTEQVFQALGATDGSQASLAKSQEAIKSFLNPLDACRGSVVENGSGLSWNTRLSVQCFSAILQRSYRDFQVFADLLGSLPVGGQTGTLKSRFKKMGSDFNAQKVRAKTGTLWSKQVVTSLVGVTQAASGELVVFALIENDQRNDPGQLSVLKDWEDKCIEYIQQLRL